MVTVTPSSLNLHGRPELRFTGPVRRREGREPTCEHDSPTSGISAARNTRWRTFGCPAAPSLITAPP